MNTPRFLQTCLPKIEDFANKNGLFANISIFTLFSAANMAGGRLPFSGLV